MKNLHAPIIEFLNYYASTLNNEQVQNILNKMAVDNEAEAKALLEFLDSMCGQVASDTKSGIIVSQQTVTTYDAEKVCNEVERYLDANGYGYLTDES